MIDICLKSIINSRRLLFNKKFSYRNFLPEFLLDFSKTLYRVAHQYLNGFMRLFWGYWVTWNIFFFNSSENFMLIPLKVNQIYFFWHQAWPHNDLILLKTSTAFTPYLFIRYHSRFFVQVGHETKYASNGNKHFFTKIHSL